MIEELAKFLKWIQNILVKNIYGDITIYVKDGKITNWKFERNYRPEDIK